MGSSPDSKQGHAPKPESCVDGVPNRMCGRLEPDDPVWLCHICGHYEPMQSDRFPGGFGEIEQRNRGWRTVEVALPGGQLVTKWICPSCASASAHAARFTTRIRPCTRCGESHIADRPGLCARCVTATLGVAVPEVTR